jgi:ABC-2 type transport system permease protein
MNIYLRELRHNLKSLIVWIVIDVLFILVGFSKFSAYYKDPKLVAIIDSMPKALVSAFSLKAFNLTTVTGFYGIMITYFALMLSIAAAMWGSDIISKETRDKTVEFALTLPVTRVRLVTAKLAAAFTNCLVLLLVTWGATVAGAQSYAPTAEFYRFAAVSMVAFLFMEAIFLSLGVLLGCSIRKHKRAGSAAVSILLAAYFLSVLAGLNADLSFLKYFTPFLYFDAGAMLRESRVEIGFVLLSAGVIAACLAGAYAAYQKRDLYI